MKTRTKATPREMTSMPLTQKEAIAQVISVAGLLMMTLKCLRIAMTNLLGMSMLTGNLLTMPMMTGNLLTMPMMKMKTVCLQAQAAVRVHHRVLVAAHKAQAKTF
ncbi:hypothetical protein FACS189472_09550 [Alphaproteobacteria bacterium]|nr:hypothetical protein FACS189472_09550 [Alphaproteobacteria bacterium]